MSESAPKIGAICCSSAAQRPAAPARLRVASRPPGIGPSRSCWMEIAFRHCSSAPYSHWSSGLPSSLDMARSTWLPFGGAMPIGPGTVGATTPCASCLGTRSSPLAAFEPGRASASSRRTSASRRHASIISFRAGVDHFSASTGPSAAVSVPAAAGRTSRTSQTTPKDPRPSSRTRLKVRPAMRTALAALPPAGVLGAGAGAGTAATAEGLLSSVAEAEWAERLKRGVVVAAAACHIAVVAEWWAAGAAGVATAAGATTGRMPCVETGHVATVGALPFVDETARTKRSLDTTVAGRSAIGTPPGWPG
mmetsp:Transcript_92979/g.240212  ORF Transcript_92979/g.240212 Transcript_92979/m.240212 type:complete len:307 (+) Transcript_92979:1284-2204(+)